MIDRHQAGAEAGEKREPRVEGRARRPRRRDGEERQAVDRRQVIALVERLARQHGEGDERDRRAERAEAVDQAGASEDRRSEAEAGGDRQEAEGGDGELGRDAEDARQRHRRSNRASATRAG